MRAFGLLAACSVAAGLHAALAQQPSTLELGRLLHTHRLLQAGFEGQGVRVGVISTGASSYATLATQRVLPSDVLFVGPEETHGDEGDWMLQIVHQIAPRAHLAFCTGGPVRETDDCARELVGDFHADLVVDDTNPQPVFDFASPKAIAFAELAREHPQVLFFTGAGNNGGGYYQGAWTPLSLLVDGRRHLAQDFGRSMGGNSDPYETVSVPASLATTVLLGTSADPTGEPDDCSAESADVTLALLDMRGDMLASVSSRCPVLRLRYRLTPLSMRQLPLPLPIQKLRITVLIPAHSRPEAFTLKLVALVEGRGISPIALSYHTGGGAGNSAIAQHLIAVAAVDPNSRWHDRYLYEAFANSGPQCLDYDRSASGRWMPLPEPRCIRQPAFVVPDRDPVLVYTPMKGSEYRPFLGDSAAGPAAAGVAALLLSAHVPADRIVPLLEQSAIPQTGSPGWNVHYGYGLLDADAAAVAAGVLPAIPGSASGTSIGFHPVAFHPSPAFLQDHSLARRARQGDGQALAQLTDEAQTGDADAQIWLARYAHSVGNDALAARWALAAATQGEADAQSFLGSMYNRGWGVPMDPRAAQAWWLRAARAGVAAAMFNMGTTVTGGRGAPPDPALGYALIRAAELLGFRFPPMHSAIARARARLDASKIKRGEILAARYAADPSSIPVP